MNYDNLNWTVALKHGLAMEIHAKQKYQWLQLKGPTGLKLEIVGLMILKKHPFIAAPPNCLVTCRCCGDDGLFVVKPHNIQNEKPSVATLDNLESNKDGSLHLINYTFMKHSWYFHEYYYHIQTKVGVSNKKYCYSSFKI